MESSAQRRRDLEINLRKAFSNDELELHYQPIVDLAKGRVVCLEALMRWTHPKHGPVSPDEFIGLAEEIGLINSMGEWALRRACADAAQWPSQWRLAVNISPRQFRNSGLLATVVGALAASGLRPNWLELEITESLFLDGNAETVETLNALRNLGVRVVLDDFGIGCAGLSYLRSFRFDGLKIDKSFVQTMSKDRASAAIVRSAIGLGASLGMKTIGEGVENEVELRCLVREGCSEAQGFFLGRPRPFGDVPATIESAERSVRDWIVSPQSLLQVVSRVLRLRKNIPRNVRLGRSVD